MRSVCVEVALLLKAAGYDERENLTYEQEDGEWILQRSYQFRRNSEIPANEVAAPSRWEAMAWLRDKHGIEVYWMPKAKLEGVGYDYIVNVSQYDEKGIPGARLRASLMESDLNVCVEYAIKWAIENVLNVKLSADVRASLDDGAVPVIDLD